MDRAEILRRLARVVREDTLAIVAAELDAPGGLDEPPRWLNALLEAAEYLPLPEVPPVVGQDLRRVFSGPALPERYRAVLVTDSRTDRRLVGVRGDAGTSGWSLSFTSEVADLVVDVWPAADGGYEVEGQVMPHAVKPSAYRVIARGPQTARAEGDRLGRFRLGKLVPGRYDLAAADGRIEISAAFNLDEGGP